MLTKFLVASKNDYAVVWQPQAARGISVKLIWSMAREIRRHRPVLVHVRGLGNEGFHGVLAARLGGADKVLLSIHGTQRDLESGKSALRRAVVVNILEQLSLWLADNITTVCEFAARRPFLDRFRYKLLSPVPNGVSLPCDDIQGLRQSTRAALGIDDHALVFVSVSRLSIEKGLEDLAQASSLVATHGAAGHLVIVGDGPDRSRIEAAFRTTPGLRVHFVGHQDDVQPYFRSADVFVFPTWHENLSNALIEALANGLPVVATDVGGNTEVVKRGGGLLVPARDADALAGAMLLLAGDSPLRRQLGSDAVANVAAHYSLASMVQAWEALYEHVIAGTRP